jgi:hypothetical protein
MGLWGTRIAVAHVPASIRTDCPTAPLTHCPTDSPTHAVTHCLINF